jgi:hypothetical protein
MNNNIFYSLLKSFAPELLNLNNLNKTNSIKQRYIRAKVLLLLILPGISPFKIRNAPQNQGLLISQYTKL